MRRNIVAVTCRRVRRLGTYGHRLLETNRQHQWDDFPHDLLDALRKQTRAYLRGRTGGAAVGQNPNRNWWPNTCLLSGLLAAYGVRHDADDLRAATTHVYRLLGSDGGVAEPIGSVDQCWVGYALLEFHQLTGDDSVRKAADCLAQFLMEQHARTTSGTLPYRQAQPEVVLSDGLAFACPFLARYARVAGSTECADLAVAQLSEFLDTAIDRYSGLPFHGYVVGGTPNLGVAGWARGCGWLAVALADTLLWLPPEHPGHGRLVVALSSLIESLSRYHSASGCWHWAVTNPVTYDDTSGTALIGCAVERMLQLGAAEQRWAQVSERALRGVSQNTTAHGFVYQSQAECGPGPGFYPSLFCRTTWAQGAATAHCALYVARILGPASGHQREGL